MPHLIAIELEQELTAKSIPSQSRLDPINLPLVIVNIQPKPTERRSRRGVIENEARQFLVETELSHLLDEGVDDGVLERDVQDLLA